VNVIPDRFDFKTYVAVSKQNADVLRTSKLDLVDAFYGAKLKGDPMPWAKTVDRVSFKPGEVTLWPGISGHGKSLITTQAAFHLAAIGRRVGIVSLEMRPVVTMARMARMVCGSDKPTEAWLQGFQKWADDKLFLMGVQGMVDPQRVLDFCRYVSGKLGVTHIFLDNLTKIVRSEDDFNAQKNFVDDIGTIARDCRVHIHLVCHTRKPESEYQMPEKHSTRGTSATVDQADNVIIVFRNRRKEDELAKPSLDPAKRTEWESKPDAFLIVAKQRNGDWEGMIGLFVDRKSMWFGDTQGFKHPMPQLFALQGESVDDSTVPF
jgi:twinkle protein